MARQILARASAALLMWLTGAASAASFQVTPTLASVEPGSGVASLRIENQGATALSVQVDALSWSQHGSERTTPSNDLVIVPRIATLQPGGSQLVRVALRNPARHAEIAYRIQFTELPPPAVTGSIGVRTLLRVDIPLFFRAAVPPPDVHWSASLGEDGALVLQGRNAGGSHLRLAGVRVVDARGALLAEHPGPVYVLGGQVRALPLTTHARLTRGDAVHLQAGAEGSVQPLTVQ